MSRSLVVPLLFACSFADSALAREADLDTRFSGDGKFTLSGGLIGGNKSDLSRHVVRDRDGGYVLVGFSSPDYLSFQRVRSDGFTDLNWGRFAYHTPLLSARAAATDAQGRIVVVGNTHKSGGAAFDFDPVVCRFLADGSIDTNLGATGCKTYPIDLVGGGWDSANAVTTGAGGEIYVGGFAQMNGSGDYDFLVMKLSATTATPMAGFGANGYKTIAFDVDTTHTGGDDDEASAIVSDGGALYVGGFAAFQGAHDVAIAKLHATDGSLDTTFCPTGACDGSGSHNGKLSTGYNFGGGKNDDVRALAMTPAGNLAFAVQTDQDVNGTPYVGFLVATLNPADGEGRQQFYGFNNAQTILQDLELDSMTVRSDNKIVVAGTTAGAPGQADPQRYIWVAQTLSNGSPDNNFSNGLFGGTSPYTIVSFPAKDTSQPVDHRAGEVLIDHGRILVAGAYLYERDVPGGVDDFNFAIARLQGDGIFADGFTF